MLFAMITGFSSLSMFNASAYIPGRNGYFPGQAPNVSFKNEVVDDINPT